MTEEKESENNKYNIKVYRRRWYILSLYSFYAALNIAQSLQYSVIPEIVMNFYKINNLQLNLLAMIMVVSFVVFAFPVARLMDKIGVRWCAIIGAAGTAAGACMKLFSANPNGYFIALIGQSIVATSGVFIISMPTKISSIWFGKKEVSTACCIGVMGCQMGMVLGLILPPLLVTNNSNLEETGKGLFNLLTCFASASSVLAILVIFTFREKPSLPPTISQAKAEKERLVKEIEYFKVIKAIFTNLNLLSYFILAGLNIGSFNTFFAFLGQIMSHYFPNREEETGKLALVTVMTNIVVSVLFGFILDITKRFKLIMLFLYFMSAVSYLIFTLLLECKILWIIYIANFLLGSFFATFHPVSFDVATEMTYPESELTIGTIMNIMGAGFTIVTTLLFSYIYAAIGYFWGNIVFTLVLLFGSLLTLPIRVDIKRTLAQNLNLHEEKKLIECVTKIQISNLHQKK